MFRIGDFSRIARVSCRLLRYYDEIGLLKPSATGSDSGYRYYTSTQLERLNRILVLKDLGFSLDEVTRIVADKVSADELRGMLVGVARDIDGVHVRAGEHRSEIGRASCRERVSKQV